MQRLSSREYISSFVDIDILSKYQFDEPVCCGLSLCILSFYFQTCPAYLNLYLRLAYSSRNYSSGQQNQTPTSFISDLNIKIEPFDHTSSFPLILFLSKACYLYEMVSSFPMRWYHIPAELHNINLIYQKKQPHARICH